MYVAPRILTSAGTSTARGIARLLALHIGNGPSMRVSRALIYLKRLGRLLTVVLIYW